MRRAVSFNKDKKIGPKVGIKRLKRRPIELPHPLKKWMRRFFLYSEPKERILIELVEDPLGDEISRLIDEGFLDPKMNLRKGWVHYVPTKKLIREGSGEWSSIKYLTITPLRRSLAISRLRRALAQTGYAMHWSSTRYESPEWGPKQLRLDAIALVGTALLGIRVILSREEAERLKEEFSSYGRPPKIDAMLYVSRSPWGLSRFGDSVRETGRSYFLDLYVLMESGAETGVRESEWTKEISLAEFLKRVEDLGRGIVKKEVEKKPILNKIHPGSRVPEPKAPYDQNSKGTVIPKTESEKVQPKEDCAL